MNRCNIYQSFHSRRVLQFRDFSKKSGCYRTKGFFRPSREPINGTTIHQRGKLAETRPKYLTNWTVKRINPYIRVLGKDEVASQTKEVQLFRDKISKGDTHPLTMSQENILQNTVEIFKIGHFRVHVCLLFKASPSAKLL